MGLLRAARQQGMRRGVELAEAGRIPDAAIRAAVRARTAGRLRALRRGTVDDHWERRRALIADRAARPITAETVAANTQHYEVPARFFEVVLGPRLKYSSAIWPDGGGPTLADAEEHTLALTAERAGLADGQRVLDLGCGWGSFTLWAAERFPGCEITALSNSHSQRELIEARAADRGLTNVRVVTGDAGTIDLPGRFDRIVSVEMMEHVDNHRALLAKLAAALEPNGRLFVHVFTHATESWEFDAGDDDWIGRWFFTGGTMPSDDLLLHEQRDLVLLDHWRHAGTHYERTLNAWLDRLDERHDEALDALRGSNSDDPVEVQLQRWRMFFMTSAEVWGFRAGTEFLVSHYLFAPRA